MASDELDTWLGAAKAAFLAHGFKRDPKAFRKPGQVWSLIRQEDNDMQLHIRAFRDGRLESEVELSNKYVQHLWSHRRSAHAEVMSILKETGMPTERVSETFVPITGTKEGKKMPEGRVKNRTAAAAAIAVGLGLMVGKHYVQKVIFRAIPAAKGAEVARKVLRK